MNKHEAPKLSSNKPYLLRAFWEWLSDNGCRPHIVVDIKYPGVVLPPALRTRDPQILNISMAAADKLQLGLDTITCNTRVGGAPCAISLPVDSILAMYSPDSPANGAGMTFTIEQPSTEGAVAEEVDIKAPSPENTDTKKKPSFLSVVK